MIENDQSPGRFPSNLDGGGGRRKRRLSRRVVGRPVLAAALAASAAVAGSLTAAGSAGGVTAGPRVHASQARPSGLVLPRAAGKLQTMIVLLRGSSTGSIHAREATAARSQAPIVSELRTAGAQIVATTSVLNTVIAKMTAAQAKTLAFNPAVAHVYPSITIPAPKLQVSGSAAASGGRGTVAGPVNPKAPILCGSAKSPMIAPEALGNMNVGPAAALGINGSGVTVAFLAGSVDPNNPDFLRNKAFGGTPGKSIVTQVDFTGDGTAVPGGDASVEGFGDGSSIAAQANNVYDLSKFVNPAHPLPAGCDIKIQGDAPGASLQSDVIFSGGNGNGFTTSSDIVEGINYAATHGVKVINESFGGNPFPDGNDLTRLANDAAVSAGVTVVASSGDAGVTSTQGSPSTDPLIVSAGASTTFLSYAQLKFGGINWPGWNGTFLDNNLSSLSSAGWNQAGGTISLVAPGDLGWALCSANAKAVAPGFCTNESGGGSNIQNFGGTSQSSPFIAGAAADVIQAYLKTHPKKYPSPALVKQILVSTATDISAPAVEQGAGIVNIGAAVKMAESLPGTSAKPTGGLLFSTNQINVSSAPGASSTHPVTITNEGASTVSVGLTTRTLKATPTKSTTGSFCLNPGTAAAVIPGCGSTPVPPVTTTFPIWSGAVEVYKALPFAVAAGAQRLEFALTYPNTGQASLLHFGLFSPSGAFAAYSLPQGLGDYGEVEVANPQAGTWHAVLFTLQDTGGSNGTTGLINWQATAWNYQAADKLSASTVSIGAGKSATVTLTVKAPTAAGDSGESIVIHSPSGFNTIPVTVRTLVATSAAGGAFTGVLTGGNGRGAPGGGIGVSNTYVFNVPSGSKSLNLDIHMASNPAVGSTPGTELLAYLVDPNGEAVSYSTNYVPGAGGVAVATRDVSVYHASPMAGAWRVLLQWPNPVSGAALSVGFGGKITFNAFAQTNTLPNSATKTVSATSGTTYTVHLCNPSLAPQAYFADPRLTGAPDLPYQLFNVNAAPGSVSAFGTVELPFAQLLYFVPPDSNQLQASLFSSLPVTFDLSYFPGDPDVSPAVKAPGVSGSQSGDESALTFSSPEIAQGLWNFVPAEVGPFGASGNKAAVAQASLTVVTQQFDAATTSSTGDFWPNQTFTGPSSTFTPALLASKGCGNITGKIMPTASVGSVVHGVLYLDDYVLGSNITSGFVPSNFGLGIIPSGDQIIGIPYTYKVSA